MDAGGDGYKKIKEFLGFPRSAEYLGDLRDRRQSFIGRLAWASPPQESIWNLGKELIGILKKWLEFLAEAQW